MPEITEPSTAELGGWRTQVLRTQRRLRWLTTAGMLLLAVAAAGMFLGGHPFAGASFSAAALVASANLLLSRRIRRLAR